MYKRQLLADKIAQWNEKGLVGKSVRVMVVGIPNVGKSKFINRILGRKSAKAADRPGVTRGSQWFRVERDVYKRQMQQSRSRYCSSSSGSLP